MFLVKICDRFERNVILSQNLVICIAKGCQIGVIDGFHETIDYFLNVSIRCNGGCHGNQSVFCHLPATVLFLCHGESSQITAIFAGGRNVGIAVANGLLQNSMGMTADDEVNVRNLFCKNLILGFGCFGIGAAVGNTDNHIGIFLSLDFCNGFLCCLNRIPEFQHTGGGTGKGIFSEDAENRHLNSPFMKDDVILHAVVGKGFLQQLLFRGESFFLHGFPVDVTEYHGGDCIAALRGCIQGTGESGRTVVKFVVAKSGNLALQCTQHAELRSLCMKNGLYQRAHGKISGINDKGIGILSLCLPNQCTDAGKASCKGGTAVLYGIEAVQMGMGVMGENNIYLFALRSGFCACGA